ncbi:MAG: response regulator [Colwellia sp.]|uniref:response regulator n=1 Tax=Colwellia sp. TaxID=56799 RepID=UPI001DF7CFF5|nr:response regulator [Colwellia sp.]MCJ8293663.1 response regulator [Colwellia sp.]NQY48769.1 response regulator [Colwellia sp.]
MSESLTPITIHMCDDDPDDQLLVSDALEEARLGNPIDFTNNGKELLQYLNREGAFAHLIDQPLPGLILLDLNMPVMDGREVLNKIKQNEKFRSIPIIVLTTSKAEADIARTYEMGVNSFIIKPVSFDSLVEMVRSVSDYWFHLVSLPKK